MASFALGSLGVELSTSQFAVVSLGVQNSLRARSYWEP